ncbi:MAG: hypothetical protein Q7J29_01385 [Stagnimonas sp.]|nr:hypothetical protein [Stagnimonas sp.]
MLRYLFVLDVAFAVLGASMVIGVGVSALLLAWYLDVAPEQRASMHALLVLTVAYTAVTLAAAAGGWGIRTKARWQWFAQAAFAALLIASYFISIQVLGST